MRYIQGVLQVMKELISLRESAILSRRVDDVARALYDESENMGDAEPWEKAEKYLWQTKAREALGLGAS